MIIVGHDLSTNAGWAVLRDGRLENYGLIAADPKDFPLPYPGNYIATAKHIAAEFAKVWKAYPDCVAVIEETNKSSRFTSRYSQKLLEFIHFAVCDEMLRIGMSPRYMNTKDWRKLAHVTIDEAAKGINKEVEAQRQAYRMKLETMIRPAVAKTMTARYPGRGPEAIKLLHQKIDEETERLIRTEMGKFRAVIGGLVVGTKTNKHLAIQRCNQLFGTAFAVKDNDIAEAALLAYGYHIKSKQTEGMKHGNRKN